MAISFAESRLAPLVETDPAWKPFGLFARLPPAMEMLKEEFAEDASPRFGGRLWRSHSWSGFAAHRVARGRRVDGKVSSDAIPKERARCGEDGEPPRSPSGTPPPKTAPWASWASECEEDNESELAHFDSPHKPESSRRTSVAGFFMDTPVSSDTTPKMCAQCGDDGESRCSTRWPSWASECEEEEEDEAAAPPVPPKEAPQSVTTLMVQNLKRNLTRGDFMRSLDEQDFAGKYDFVHLPKSLGKVQNNGFAFVNFKTLEYAEEFASHIAHIKGSKMRAVPAAVQGLGANAWKAGSRRRTRIRDSASRPLVVSGHGQDAPWHA